MRNFLLGATTVLLCTISYSALASCAALSSLEAKMANPSAHCSPAFYTSLLSQIKYNSASTACGTDNEANSLYSYNLNLLAEECGGLLYANKMEATANQANAASNAAAAASASARASAKQEVSSPAPAPAPQVSATEQAAPQTTDNTAGTKTESEIFSAPKKSSDSIKNNPWF